MDLAMGPLFSITSASLSAFDTIAIIILVPIYDRLLIPALRHFNMAPTYLQRIGIGLGVGYCQHAPCCALRWNHDVMRRDQLGSHLQCSSTICSQFMDLGEHTSESRPVHSAS